MDQCRAAAHSVDIHVSSYYRNTEKILISVVTSNSSLPEKGVSNMYIENVNNLNNYMNLTYFEKNKWEFYQHYACY